MSMKLILFAVWIALVALYVRKYTQECQIPAVLAQNYLEAEEIVFRHAQKCLFQRQRNPKLQSSYADCGESMEPLIMMADTAMRELQKAISRCEE